MDGNGKLAVCSLGNGSIMFRDVEVGAQLGRIASAYQGFLCSVAMSGDGRHVISGSVDSEENCGTRKPYSKYFTPSKATVVE